jgi:phage terminase large subunit-like protein
VQADYQNTDRADRVISFIEKLKVTIGEDSGQPFVLRPWQKAFIRDVYAPTRHDGRRTVRRAILSMGRKNGKTELAAALILAHLIGPEAETNGEIYSAANDRQQAAIVFGACKRFIQASPTLARHLRIVDSTKTIFVVRSDGKAAGSKFRALSADAGRQHGLNPSLVIVDELAQARSRELFDTLATSQGARSEPLLVVISTQNDDPQHVLSEMIDDGLKDEDPTTVCHLYAAPDGCDLLDEDAWLAANPALGDFLDLDAFRADAQRAKRLPAEEQSFRLLRLNQRVAREAALISRADWLACLSGGVFPEPTFTADDAFQFEPGEPVYLGLDMSLRTDLTALVAVSAHDGSRVKSWFFKPREALRDHGDRDRQNYELHERHGWMIATPGRSIDPAWVAAQIKTINDRNPVIGLAYDRAYTGELMRCMADLGLMAQEGHGDGLRIVPWGQGFVSMGKAINAFEHAVLQAELHSDGNPLLTFSVGNALAVTDPAGNRKFDKSSARKRMDGAVALAMALGLKAEDRLVFAPTNPWEDPNFSLLGPRAA